MPKQMLTRVGRTVIGRLVVAALVGIGTLAAGLSFPVNQLARADVQAQFTLVFPTSTRTPTPINIGNFVWDDLDQDGRQDAGEPGMAGVVVQLWNSAKTSLIAQTTTSGTGSYTVIAPVPGNYRIRVVLPGFLDSFTGKDLAGDDQLDSDINPSGPDIGFTDVFNLASNVISTTIYDAGIIIFRTPTPTRTPTPINIGNFVWRDTNGDGIQNGGETGVGAAQVQLWNAAKTQLIDTAYTNAAGNYTVVAPVPGDYRIRVVLPGGGVSFSPKDQGANDQLDSDINPSGTNLGFSDTFTLASNVISTTIYDVGLLNAPASFPTPSPTVTATPVNTATPTPTGTLLPTATMLPQNERLWLPDIQK